MPRLARKYLESSFIHIIVQGINKEYIFQKNSFKDAYLNILKKIISETDIKVMDKGTLFMSIWFGDFFIINVEFIVF